jgi:two-component system response regulator MtrA
VNERILLVEDDESLREAIDMVLKDAGFFVAEAIDGVAALDQFHKQPFDLVVLDVMLPEMDGLDVCRSIRRESNIPILMLTARATTTDVVVGIGADDYVTKPFEPEALVARMRALLRRASAEFPEEAMTFGPLVLSTEAHRLTKNGVEIELTMMELRLLHELMLHKNQVLTRDALLRRVWEYEYAGDSRMVDMAINRLRSKIEDNPANPRFIKTARGFGYRFETE